MPARLILAGSSAQPPDGHRVAAAAAAGQAAYDGHLAALQAIVSNEGFNADARRGDGLAQPPGPEGTPVNA
jgi:hypothetical protein